MKKTLLKKEKETTATVVLENSASLNETAKKKKRDTRNRLRQNQWRITDADKVYHVYGWGTPYFSIHKNGHLMVHPKGQQKRSLSLRTLVDQIVERGIQPPFLLRFNDILTHRIIAIQDAFRSAIKEYNYSGQQKVVFPIKVNQQRHVVEQIVKPTAGLRCGLEAGSKPELVAVLALTESSDMPVVCNGYKDKEYFEIALMGTKMGKPVYPVIEKFSEFKSIIEVATELKVKPTMGVRVKLSSTGAGRWQNSGGHHSKFGLTITELMKGIQFLKKTNMLSGLKLLHFHLGSQITNINSIKKALKEIGRIYVEMKKLGVPLEILDVGGGLGIDYDGSRSNQESSINYSLQEYANDVIFQIKEICDEAKVETPDIFTECGRAVAAHHAVLITNILGISGYDRVVLPNELPEKTPKPLKELLWLRQYIKRENAVEYYHDAENNFKECLSLFNLGYLSLQERGLAEEIFFSVCKRCQKLMSEEKVPDAFLNLEESLSDTYFCNLSIFQSLPDLWAIDHKFPIMPIHRLNEEPDCPATLADITCDSDGKIDSFIDPHEQKHTIRLHAHKDDEEYYLGVFLVGAYQETLGDLHNLFGDTNAVHIRLDKNNQPVIETVVKGDSVKEVLSYVQYDTNELTEKLHAQIEQAVRNKKISLKESGQFLKFYESALEGYTYLEETRTEEEF